MSDGANRFSGIYDGGFRKGFQERLSGKTFRKDFMKDFIKRCGGVAPIGNSAGIAGAGRKAWRFLL
jgi:hypothetical protein